MKKKIACVHSNVLSNNIGGAVARSVYNCYEHELVFFNTVIFSNVASQRAFGIVFDSAKWLDFFSKALLHLFDERGFDTLHTGFFGTSSQINVLHKLLENRKISPQTFLLDPIIGDNGKTFVSKDVEQNIKKLLPFADIITPNYYELEILSEISIENYDDAKRASESLFQNFPKLQAIITTSLPNDTDTITLCISQRNQEHSAIPIEKIQASFPGNGDAFSTLFSCFYREQEDLVLIVKKAASKLWYLIKKSQEANYRKLAIREFLPSILYTNC